MTVRDFDPQGKRVLVRVDFNVPIEDGKVKDDSRIRAALPTIKYLLDNGASVVLMSHLGRPKGKVVESARLRPVAQWLSALLKMPVPITGDPLGIGTRDAVARLKPGQVLMLENLRFHPAGRGQRRRVRQDARVSYGDVYVNDAFGTAHRAHASTVGVTKYLPAYAGLLMEREIEMLSKLLENVEHPFAAIIGGAKVSGKLAVLNHLMERVRHVPDRRRHGQHVPRRAGLQRGQEPAREGPRRRRQADPRQGASQERRVPAADGRRGGQGGHARRRAQDRQGQQDPQLVVGRRHRPETRPRRSWTRSQPARTVFWNGPLGVFEVPTFGDGTRAIARELAAWPTTA